MIMKKFEAPTENEAIQKGQAELGSQAVVVKAKKIEPRGLFRLFKRTKYEVTMALEERNFIDDINKKKPVMTGETTEKPAKEQTTLQKVDLIVDDEVVIEQKSNEISDMLNQQVHYTMKQNTMFQETKEENTKDDNVNVKALKLIYTKLLESEVDEKYANEIINEIEVSLKRESDVKSILAGVYQKIILKLGEPYELTKNEGRPKVIFFVGPTGVGKTTTIAKIAARLKLTDKKKVAMITADTYRISAVEQLKKYAEIIDIAVRVVYTPEEIPEAIGNFMEFDYILVDTAGRSHKNEEQIEELNEYLEVAKNVEGVDIDTILVLSATTKYRDLLAITSAYSAMQEYYLLFTKLDETSAYGNILNIRLNTGAGLTYFTMGQNVPEDIEKVNVQWLTMQIIGGNE